MARSHSTNGQAYTNPEVRFERSDVEYKGVVIFAVVLCVSLVLIVAAMIWFGKALVRREQRRDVSKLPPAFVDDTMAKRLPPEPRLEALDDIRDRRVRLYPARAEEHLEAQRKLLENGDKARGIEPISEAIEALAGRLPARKSPAGAPETFSRGLPSKAAAGRVETGGR